ncbi:4Fe-4S ferredoxin [Halarcobacter mediterraneus]|uniref:4Fe-4S ferredoxin n=1 Tax=Halarcobacter mediterraneus TaxID=2023153 RepID=A0A4Q1B5H4_9BACT|nr:4Fe-4S dicluster domain-containing protein [Halarcobacter mediterraneus]RXK14387.1 4Fe-4S ferredoxin [Halarcobacter mediterraneus]
MKEMKENRRKFIKFSTLGILGAVLGTGVVISPYALSAEMRLRPPGAVSEKEFLALCIKCGQCLQVCPYHSIKLSDMVKGHGVGTPYIDARERGCYACTAVPCVLACPSGALDHKVEKPSDIKMGIAVLEFPNKCLATTNTIVPKGHSKRVQDFINKQNNVTQLELDMLNKLNEFEGKQCTICADMCPIPNPLSAITMIREGNGKKPEIYEGCIGCGVCEELCPVNESAIVIKPRLSFEDYYKKGLDHV